MTKQQRENCARIIHGASALAALAASGMAQAPGSDSLVIVPIQCAMAAALAREFGIALGETEIKALVLSRLATEGGRKVSQWLWGWIPGWGNLWNASTAAALTEAMGWGLVWDFDRGT
jgi:uncharacterized protein (DUF697 family)